MRDSETSESRPLGEKAESLKSGGEGASTTHAASAAGQVNEVVAGISRAGEIALKRRGSSISAWVCAYMAGGFVLLWLCSLLNEVLDLPHLILALPRTPVNWGEVAIESSVIVAVSAIVLYLCSRLITERKRVEEALREKESRYRSLFDDAPISMWEEDWSAIKALLDRLRRTGVTDFRAYFDTHPEEVSTFASMVKVLNVNNVSVELYNAKSKRELLEGLGTIVSEPESHEVLKEELIAMGQGKTTFESEIVNRTLTGQKRVMNVKILVALGCEETLERVLVCLVDITDRKTAEQETLRLNRVLQTITLINQDMFRIRDRDHLLESVCRRLVQHAYKLVWIGFCESATKQVIPSACAGFEQGYLSSIRVTYDDSEYGAGPTGMAVKTGKPDVMRFINTEPRYEPWRQEALRRGYRSSAAIPVFEDEKVVGALNVYADQEDAFGEREVKLLEELAHDLSTGLRAIDEQAKRKQAEDALRESEENYRSVFNAANDAIFVHDIHTGVILDVNQKMCEMYGCTVEEARAINVETLSSGLAPFTQQEASRKIRQAAAGKPQIFEWHAKDKRGRMFWVEVSLKKAVIGGKDRILAIVRDITDRKKTEEFLETERKQFLSMFDGIDEVVYVADPRTYEILYMNEPAKRQWGDGAGRKCHRVLQNRDAPCPFCNNDKIFGESIGQSDIWEFQNELNHRWYRCIDKAIRWPDGRMVRLELAIDVTNGKLAEQKLLDYQAKLKTLTWDLLLAQEHERRRIAVGVHDQIGQRMALLKMETQAIKESVSEPDVLAALDKTCELMDQVLEDAHSLTFELSNPVLYEIGLDAAVESWLSQHVPSGSALEYKVVSEPSPLKPDTQTGIFLFGVIRELLTNVIKHAKASFVEIIMREMDGAIEVSVEDDGVGFDASKLDVSVKQTGGFGLFNARERVEYLHGDLVIESKPGSGTQVRLKVPKVAR